MKKIFKKSIAIFLCLTMVFNYSFSVLANENVESSEPETTYTETIETTESSETTESIEEEIGEEAEEEASDNFSEEIIEPEDNNEDIEDTCENEPEEDIEEEPEEEGNEDIEEVDVASPSEIVDEAEEEENEFPANMAEEPEEDEVIDEPEEPMLLGSIASPSDTEEVEEETEEEIEEATPSEIEELPMLLGVPPLFGASTTVVTWSELVVEIYSSYSGEGDTITLGTDITVDVTCTVPSTADVIIDLNGHTIDGNGNRIFILEGKLKIVDSGTGGTITGGNAGSNNGGAVQIGSDGHLILENGIFTGNNAESGGAVYVDGGTFEMNGGEISGNTAYNNGGAVYIEAGGIFTLNDGEISGNTAINDGGAVYITWGTFTMNGGEISGNTAYNNGGAVYIEAGGIFTLNDGEISGNTAINDGGAVYITWGTFTMNGGEISGNTGTSGAGVYVSDSCEKVYLGGSIVVKDNSSSSGDICNIYIYDNDNSKLEISSTDPLTSGAEIYVTLKYDSAGDWGAGKDVGQYFNSTMTDSNYQYFYFTNCGSVEKDVVYSVTKSGSNYVTALPSSSVCKIGTTEYNTLQEAIAAVTNGQTITMIDDVTYGSPITINNGKTFTIDFMDGSTQHTFKWYDFMGEQSDKDVFTIKDNSKVTVKNMKYTVGMGEADNRVFRVESTGTLTLDNMTAGGSDNNYDTIVYNDGGTATVIGGKI